MRKKKLTPWARRRRRVYAVCALFLMLLVPAVGWRMRLKSEVSREREALRALGIPTTPEALETWQSQYPELPVIEAYGKAAAAFVGLPFEEQDVLPSFRPRNVGPAHFAVPYDAALLSAMRHLVTLNEAALQLLREGRASTVEGRAAGIERTRSVGDLIQLCCAAAGVSATDGHGAAAADAVLDGLAFLRASDAQPWSRSLLSWGDEVEQLMSALASAASRVVLPEEKLREIQTQMAVSDWVEEARLSSIYWIALRLSSFSSEQLDSPPARIADVFFGFFDRYMTYTMRSQRMRFSLIGKSISEQKAEFDAMKRRHFSRDFVFSGPPMHLAVASVGIEVICYYQKTGALPESLDALARDGLDFADFFSGKSLVYRPQGRSFALYSVGRDLEDNGGEAQKDVVFRGEWPAA